MIKNLMNNMQLPLHIYVLLCYLNNSDSVDTSSQALYGFSSMNNCFM